MMQDGKAEGLPESGSGRRRANYRARGADTNKTKKSNGQCKLRSVSSVSTMQGLKLDLSQVAYIAEFDVNQVYIFIKDSPTHTLML